MAIRTQSSQSFGSCVEAKEVSSSSSSTTISQEKKEVGRKSVRSRSSVPLLRLLHRYILAVWKYCLSIYPYKNVCISIYVCVCVERSIRTFMYGVCKANIDHGFPHACFDYVYVYPLVQDSGFCIIESRQVFILFSILYFYIHFCPKALLHYCCVQSYNVDSFSCFLQEIKKGKETPTRFLPS